MTPSSESRPTRIDESARRRFEEAWMVGTPLDLADGLPDQGHSDYLPTLEELVHIQLEFAWKTFAAGTGQRPESVESLLARFPALANKDVLPGLLRQEFHSRKQAGDQPSAADYSTTYPRIDLDDLTVPPGETVGPTASDDTAAVPDDQATMAMPGTEPPGSVTDDVTLAGPAPGTSVADDLTIRSEPSSSADDATLAGENPGVFIEVGEDDDTFDSGDGGAADSIAVDLGEQIPGYELLGELGRGGMGVVYRALDKKLKRVVALKMVLSGANAGADELKRFQREAEAVARLQHPSIVQIHEVAEHNGRPYIALEYVDGGGLDAKIAGEPQTPSKSARWVEQLAEAVGYAHDRNIVHRDLKPANILLTSDGQPKITDFGLAKQIDDGADVSQTASGSIMGTPSYMAPEQAGTANAVLGPSTDVYALGAILYCLLTGRPPFQSSSAMDTVMQVIEQDPVPPCQLVSGLDRNLETITLKCLQKDPDKRYQTAGELAEELRRFQNGEPILARPVGPIIRVAKWCRRKPLLATLWGSVAALIAFVTVNGHYEAQTQAELARQADENRQVAEIQKTIAEQDRQLAVEARAEIRQRAIIMNLDEGTRLLDRNQPTNALARFAAAFELQASGNYPLQTMINRIRLSSVIRVCPRPTAIWPLTTANVTFCDFTADGKIAVIGEFNGVIRLFNTETGKPIGEPLENDGYVMSVALSPDGDKAAACIVYEIGGKIPQSVIRVWDLKTQKKTRVRSMKHTGMAEVLGYHPDGKRLLTCEVRKAGDERDATLWDSESGKKLLTMKHSSDIRWAGFFPDGRRLATVNYADNFRIWDCQTGKQTGRSLTHSNQSLRHAAISGDGSKITTAGYSTARIWDAATLEPLTGQLQIESGIKDVQLSHDGSLLLTTLNNWDVQVWDTETGNPRLSPIRHDSNVIQAKFSPDDRLIVTGSADGTARVWSTTNGQLEASFHHNKPVIHVAFHPDCRRILTGSAVMGLLATSGADARLWDLAITRGFAETELKHDDDVRALAMSSDGELIATGGLDHRVRVWSSARGTAVTGWLDLGEPVADVSFHAKNKIVFAHGTGKTATAWKVPSGQLIGKTIQVADGLADAAMTPDGSVIATVSSSDKVQQWNSQTGASLAEATSLAPSLTLGSFETHRKILFSPSGDQLVGIHSAYPAIGIIRSWKTGSATPGTLQVIGLRPGVNLTDSSPDALKLTAIPQAVTFRNDGKACLVVSQTSKDFRHEREIQVITLDPLSTIFKTPVLITEEVTRAVFNPEGTAFLTASRNNSARVWDSTSGRPNTRLLKHHGDVEWIATDAKGQLFVTCGTTQADKRGFVQVWDMSTGFPITTIFEHPKAVRRAILAPDGSRVVTACDDGRVRIWQLPQETRTAGQVVQTASLLVGKSTDLTGNESFMAESDFHDGWKQLQQSAGELFTPSKKQIVAWHLDATSNMDIIKDGPRYLNHLDTLIAVDDQANWRYRRSEVLAGMGQFDRAMADYDVLTGREYLPNHILSRAGFCALLAGRTKTLDQHTSVLVKRTEDKKNPGALVSASALLLIAPNDQSKNAESASQFLDRYLKDSTTTPTTTIAQLLSGLAQVRIGKPDVAIQRLNKLLTRLAQPQSKAHRSELAICHMSIALAHAAKGDAATAEKSRQLASKLIENHSHSYRHSIYWHLCEVLRRELIARNLKANT